jgi:inorganic pyrophosphatase/exopolyphosphatase
VFREPEGAPHGRANPTGSAQSVIVELFKKEIGQKQTFDHHLADLAMATILIDTDNVSRAINR